MKRILFISALLITIFSCKKENDPAAPEHVKSAYQVWAIGQDTVKTPFMWARTEALPVTVAEDDYLRIEILGYTNGQYVLSVKNKQNCDADFQLSYQDIAVSAISPDRKNNLYVNQVKKNRTEIFYITGTKHIGKIKAKALTICNWSCDPVWLSVDITAAILPIKYLSYNTETHDGFVTINWEIEDPTQADKYLIAKVIDGVLTPIWSKSSDKTTKQHSINIWETETIK